MIYIYDIYIYMIYIYIYILYIFVFIDTVVGMTRCDRRTHSGRKVFPSAIIGFVSALSSSVVTSITLQFL